MFLLVLLKIINATSGIIVIIGTLVNMAMPINIPDSRGNAIVLLMRFWISVSLCFTYIANSIEESKKGSRIDSRSILRVIQLNGITAKRIEAINATLVS